jgi:glycosyltransferase involved in cell wall biosynthesis
MKIAIYTIALNERQFVDKWFEAAKGADYLLIADTGSTDGTVERAR